MHALTRAHTHTHTCRRVHADLITDVLKQDILNRDRLTNTHKNV